MFHRLRNWTFLPLLALLAGVFFAFAPGRHDEAKATLGPLQAVTLTAADFHPRAEIIGYSNSGYYLTSSGIQLARIPFPGEAVVISSVRAWVYDSAGVDMCVAVHRAVPAEAARDQLGSACTSGSSNENPQVLTIPAISTRVGRHHAAYVEAVFQASNFDLKLYGVTVFYRVVT